MLTEQDWNIAARRLLDNVVSNTRELPDDVYEMPASYYSDEDRWKREIEHIFKKKPLILALSCELAQPNSFKAMDRLGLPLLLTRSDDGKVRGFINACRHRGAVLTGETEKCGVAKRFTCPYHAWTFNNKGALVGVPWMDQFGDIPDDYRRLIPIPVEEKAGFIWGILTPDADINVEEYLGDMLPMLEKLGLSSFHFAGEASIAGSNWKLAQDGYIEHYHFNVLHKDTFGALLLSDFTALDQAGLHSRYLVPSTRIRDLQNLPENEWKASNYLFYAFSIFPNTAIGLTPNENPQEQTFVMSQVWPGDTPETSIAYQIFATQKPMISDEEINSIKKTIETTISIVEREDYWAIKGQQYALESMTGKNYIFGRLEPMVQTFEKGVNAIVDSSYEHGV